MLIDKDITHWAQKVKKRDGYRCVRCKGKSGLHKRKDLDAHHIFPQSWYPKYRFHIRNGITLCSQCHGLVLYKKITLKEDRILNGHAGTLIIKFKTNAEIAAFDHADETPAEAKDSQQDMIELFEWFDMPDHAQQLRDRYAGLPFPFRTTIKIVY